jgi:uncharacterized membrane protein
MTTLPNRDDGRSFRDWYEQKMENTIANLLRGGVLFSAFVVIAGAVLYLGAHPRAHVAYHTFAGEPEQLKNVHGIVRLAFSGQARGIMQLGLLLLIATPVARVVFSIFAFIVERDRMYVVFTLIVLSVLLYSLFGSFLIA